MHRNSPTRTTIRFRHWTRKGYAAFASLGRCVTIGQLRKNVTERALTKQATPTLALSLWRTEEELEAGKAGVPMMLEAEAMLGFEWIGWQTAVTSASISEPDGGSFLLYIVQIMTETHGRHRTRCLPCVSVYLSLSHYDN